MNRFKPSTFPREAVAEAAARPARFDRDREMRRPRLEVSHVKTAYRRHVFYYDAFFGTLLGRGRAVAVDTINALSGRRILEVGVGTGLALPFYRRDKSVVGIDISPEMLKKARHRIAARRLANVEALLEMDAQNLAFAADSFDAVVAMYVASGVTEPIKLLREMQRVCVPGGDIVFVGHTVSRNGLLRGVVQHLSRLSRFLGWRPDFNLRAVLGAGSVDILEWRDVDPLGIATLVRCRNRK